MKVRTDGVALDRLLRHLGGLTEIDARRLIRNAIYDDGPITEKDLPQVTRLKYQLRDQGGALSFELDTARLAAVSGLDTLRRGLGHRNDIFLAPHASLDPPKGILLAGVQGGGKSLAAKAVAGLWQLALLRPDFGTLYNRYFGETEATCQVRCALPKQWRLACCGWPKSRKPLQEEITTVERRSACWGPC